MPRRHPDDTMRSPRAVLRALRDRYPTYKFKSVPVPEGPDWMLFVKCPAGGWCFIGYASLSNGTLPFGKTCERKGQYA